MTYLEVITVRVGDLRATHGTANGCDWNGRNASLSEAGQERVEVIDKERVQRRPGGVCVGDYVYPARLGQPPCCLVVVWNKIGRPANESLVPARGRIAVGYLS